MGLQVQIAGTNRQAAMQFKSLRITDTIVSNTNTLEAEFSTTGDWRPKAGNEIIISTTSDAVRQFGGMLIDVYENVASRAPQLHYRVTGKDYTWLLDRRMTARNYTAQAASAIIADVISKDTTGFSTSGVQVAPSVAAQRYNYVYPSDVIRGLADQLQWNWYVDYSKVVQFFPAISNIAPTTAINFDTNTANYGDLEMHESAAGIKNRVIVEGYNIASTVPITRSFQGDSLGTRFFLLGYEPVGVAAADITAKIDGVSLDILTDNIDGSPGTSVGTSSQIFICFANLGARMSTGGLAPSSSQTLTFVFNQLLPGGISYDDPVSQAEMASRSSGDGIHMYHLSDPNMTNFAANDDLANAVGQAIASRDGKPSLEGTFHSDLQGWRAGQYFTGTSAYRMGGFTAKTFYVHQVTTYMITHPSGGSPTWRAEVTISDSQRLS